jgi:hypothetical protein
MGIGKRNSIIAAAIAALGVMVFVFLPGDEKDESDPVKPVQKDSGKKDSPPVEDDISPADVQKVGEIIADRRKLDLTVWSTEIAAQRHEEPFIELWDTLRSTQKKFEVLANFQFESLVLGLPGEGTQFDHGIRAFHCDNGTKTYEPNEWRNWLRDLKNSGLRIVQSEWHHSQFEPDEKGARSVVSFVLYVVDEPQIEYHIISGKLKVDWQPEMSAGKPQAKTIAATDVKILSRKAEPIFREAAILDVSASSRVVLIARDVDGDGLSDLVSPTENSLYLNRGSFKFERRPLFDFKPPAPILAGVMADFNNDGRADFLGCCPKAVLLYVADENGRFSTKPNRIPGIGDDIMDPVVVSAGDIDGDGDLDVWLGQYKAPYVKGQMPTPYFDANDGFPAFLLKNNGQGEFTDVTEAAGLAAKRHRRTYSASLVDLDGDLDLDLVVVSDFSGVDLYMNDGSGNMTDVTDERVDLRHAFGMSLSLADYNFDSKLDFFMTGMSSTTAMRLHKLGLGPQDKQNHQANRLAMGYGNRLYLARGSQFKQASFNSQVARTGWSWGSTSFDFDNDGDRDIFVANGHRSRSTAKDYCTHFWCHDIYSGSSKEDPALGKFFQMNLSLNFSQNEISWNGFEHNALLMNQNGKQFMSMGFLAGVASEFDSRNVISDDFNGDGRVDLLVLNQPANRSPAIHIFKNNYPANANWIGFRLDGLNHPVLGAQVNVVTPERIHVAAVVAGDSFGSQHAPVVHFGLGTSTQVTSVKITWPDGRTVSLDNPTINKYHRFK